MLDSLLGLLKFPRSFVYSITIAANTIGFAIKDLSIINYALISRGFDSKRISKQLKRALYIGVVIILSNITRIESLNLVYGLRIRSGPTENRINEIDIRIDNTSYDIDTRIANEINIHLARGEIQVIYGKTGCGKTTMLKAISGLIPHLQSANFSGEILVNRRVLSFSEYAKNISFCFQSPEEQFILSNVKREIEMDLTTEETPNVPRLCDRLGVTQLIEKSIADLSTGQRKIVSLAQTLCRNRDVIILDEPTSNLDEFHRDILLSYLKEIASEKIIVISTHDDYVCRISDKFLVYDESRMMWISYANWHDFNNDLLAKRRFVEDKRNYATESSSLITSSQVVIRAENLTFVYPDGTKALSNLSLQIMGGDIIGLFGRNGSGKTTLINLIMKKVKPTEGQIRITGIKSKGLVQQEPEKQLFSNSVYNELIFGQENYNIDQELLKSILSITGLENSLDKHPFFLSRGQKQLLLISSILLKKPDLVIIDEPFTGLDNSTAKKILNLILDFQKINKSTIIISDQSNEAISNIATRRVNLIRGSATIMD